MGLLISSEFRPSALACNRYVSLKPEHVLNSKGQFTLWETLSVVLVQIGLWVLVYLLSSWIVPHLPNVLLTGWRFPVTVFTSGVIRWFALLMVLQYVWTIVRATCKTTLMAAMAAYGSESAKKSLDEAAWQLMEKRAETETPSAKGSKTGNSV